MSDVWQDTVILFSWSRCSNTNRTIEWILTRPTWFPKIIAELFRYSSMPRFLPLGQKQRVDYVIFRNTVLLLLLVADCHYGSETRPSQPSITCASSVSPSRRTSALTSTFHIQAQRTFTGFVRFEGSVVRLTLSLQKHCYTPSSHLVLMAAMPCWPGRQKPALIVFSVC